jgi:hypothetical protein
MAPQYGSLIGFGKRIGKYDVCAWCVEEIVKKGYLHISETQYLYPSGQVKKAASNTKLHKPTPGPLRTIGLRFGCGASY